MLDTNLQKKILKGINKKFKRAKYQSPSLVIFADGNIFLNTAGTFPENDGNTEEVRRLCKSKTEITITGDTNKNL